MCDEATITEWARKGLNRRQFGVLGGMAAVAACAPASGDASDNAITLPAMSERMVEFATPDGTMDGFFVAPASNPVPSVILWPDIAGLREAKRDMARRLAGRGYATLVVNPYYRDRKGQIWEDFADFAGNGGWNIARAMRGKLNAETVMRDATAAVAWLEAQKEVDTRRGIGTQGYCMGGPFTFWTAAAVPARVRAAGSFHGGGLVKPDDAMSPHKLVGETKANFLVAISQDDDAEAPGDKTALREAFAASGHTATVEVFPADHGWCVPDSPAYNEVEAEKAWTKLLAMYGAAL
ncbi:dienelactone hydrolase family protein [Parerythrobacter lacustris]|uniref:Dienelactone hydrolase family protein n=1 Tax=Parerythrobacter lacustris TaxID=2969984 RepID=A0ABT1XR45_9SPHN|nr:dienelactone hydrolase family protein [Parerythrobacter lacustris]MCR2834133.1 dienelactone hydrolase family protein [Parerythrobacter lacustris]